jgi:hypothetical protein
MGFNEAAAPPNNIGSPEGQKMPIRVKKFFLRIWISYQLQQYQNFYLILL